MSTKAGTLPLKKSICLGIKDKVKALIKPRIKKVGFIEGEEVLNRKSERVFRDAEKGKNIESFTNSDDMFRALWAKD